MTVKTARERPGLAGMEAFFVIDQNRSSANWPLAKILQRHGDAETGFKKVFLPSFSWRVAGIYANGCILLGVLRLSIRFIRV
jgi:hypothetical protein